MRLEGVGRRYGVRGPWVLRDVDLELTGPALLRVDGANGTGKSTVLRIVAGLDRPTAGRVTGRPGRTAYVPERFPPALPFDAYGYLVHLGRVHGLRGAVAGRRAAQWLERFGIGGYARTPLLVTSGSPANAAVTGLVTGSRTGAIDFPLLPLVAAGAVTALATAFACRLAGKGQSLAGT